MAWSSKDYHYTKEEIDRTAYAAGCGNGIGNVPNGCFCGTGRWNHRLYDGVQQGRILQG